MNMKEKKAAFSLVELILIVAFLGIFAAIAVPRLNFAIISKQKADTVARKIVTDLRLIRRLAISDAANNNKGFALRFDGPGGPGGRTSYGIVDRSTQPPTVVRDHTIDSDVNVWTDKKTIRFGPLGNLLQSPSGGFPFQITASAEGKTFTITIVPATGTIKCVEN